MDATWDKLQGCDCQPSGKVPFAIFGPMYTFHSNSLWELECRYPPNAAPIALPESFGKGGTQMPLKREAFRIAEFHLIFKAAPPAKQMFPLILPDSVNLFKE